MSWAEFTSLLAGLTSDTPLAKIISIRAETDVKTIRQFNAAQRRIHSEWQRKQAANMDPDEYKEAMEGFKAMFAGLAGE